MAGRFILICFRVFIGLITFLLASVVADIFKSIRIMTSSDMLGTVIGGGILLFVVTYVLGFIIEKVTDKLSGFDTSKGVKEI